VGSRLPVLVSGVNTLHLYAVPGDVNSGSEGMTTWVESFEVIAS